MGDVFISYSSADRDRVAELVGALEKSGLSVWWDRQLAAGTSYEDEIDRALVAGKVVVVAWTPASTASQWVRSEADYARNENKLVPILLKASRVPRPFDRLHTGDLTRWRGDLGNNGFPELLEAIRSRLEGRAPKPIRWRRRITFAAVASTLVATVGLVSGVTGIVDAAMRYFQADRYAVATAEGLQPSEGTLDTQEDFQRVLKALSTSIDRRTQKALSTLEEGNQAEAIAALETIAVDQSRSLDRQLNTASTLWRQLGLLLYNDDPVKATAHLELARRYAPGDNTILVPLAALYSRAGRTADAERIYQSLASADLPPQTRALASQVIGQTALDRSELEAAFLAFDEARDLADQTGDEFLSADLTIDFGRLAIARMKLDDAIALFKEAQTFAEALPYPRSALFAQLNLVETLILQGKLADASNLLTAARTGATTQGDTVADIYLDLSAARLALATQNPAQALSRADAIGERSRAKQLRDVELQADQIAAEALIQLNRPLDAKTRAESAMFGWRSLGARDGAAISEVLAMVAGTSGGAAGCAELLARAEAAPTPYAQTEAKRVVGYTSCAAGVQLARPSE